MSNTKSFFNQTLVIKSSAGSVFNALTQADELIHWFPTRAESDPRPGGKLKLVWEFTDASQNGSQDAEFVEVTPNSMLSYTWKAESAPTMVSFKLSESNGETVLEVDHASLQEDADGGKLHQDHADQWGFFLMNLKGYLEAGMDMRREKLNQITL